MKRIPVSSSTIASVGYDDTTATLEVEFTNGLLYRYFVVPRALFDSLVAAESPGRFFNEHVRNVHPFAKVPS